MATNTSRSRSIRSNPLFTALNGKTSSQSKSGKSRIAPKSPSPQKNDGRKIMTVGSGNSIVFKVAKNNKPKEHGKSKITENALFRALNNNKDSRSSRRAKSYSLKNQSSQSTLRNKSDKNTNQVIKAGYRNSIPPTGVDKAKYYTTSRIGVDVALQNERSEIRFKDASKPTLLRIKNLVPGVDRNDVNKIMSQFGPIKEVLMKQYLDFKKKDTQMAEVFFYDERVIPTAIARMNSQIADGRRLELSQDSKSQIIKDPVEYKKLVDLLSGLKLPEIITS